MQVSQGKLFGGQTCLLLSWPPPPNSRNCGHVGEKSYESSQVCQAGIGPLPLTHSATWSSHLPPGAHHLPRTEEGPVCVPHSLCGPHGLCENHGREPVSSWGTQQTPSPSPPMVCTSPHVSIPGSHRNHHSYSGAECQPSTSSKGWAAQEMGFFKRCVWSTHFMSPSSRQTSAQKDWSSLMMRPPLMRSRSL